MGREVIYDRLPPGIKLKISDWKSIALSHSSQLISLSLVYSQVVLPYYSLAPDMSTTQS